MQSLDHHTSLMQQPAIMGDDGCRRLRARDRCSMLFPKAPPWTTGRRCLSASTRVALPPLTLITVARSTCGNLCGRSLVRRPRVHAKRLHASILFIFVSL